MVRSLFEQVLLIGLLVTMTPASAYPQQEDSQIKVAPLNIVGETMESAEPEGEILNAPTSDPDLKRLTDKWKVLYVEVDGEHGPAQIGQQVGDIISIGIKDNSFQFG